MPSSGLPPSRPGGGQPHPGTGTSRSPRPGGSEPHASRPQPPPDLAALPPAARFGKFACTEKLGAGGMGEVWKAWDTDLSRWVALKFLKGGDAEEIGRFKREAQMAGKLTHPNIAAIYEVGEAQGRHYIAMQFIDGKTLGDFPSRDPKILVRLVRDAAVALDYAHEQKIVHRDLKPDNLMVVTRSKAGPKGPVAVHHVYVMDFGLARPAAGDSNVSLPGVVIGTPAYMSPEQARGERLDRRADVYSLGATLYELLTGRRPFSGKGVLAILRSVQEDDPVAPRRLNGRIDADLETIVLKCLEKERVRRYRSAAELADELTRWLEGEPIEAKPASVVYRLKKALAKRKPLVIVCASALAVIFFALVILVPKFREEAEEAQKKAAEEAEARTEAQKRLAAEKEKSAKAETEAKRRQEAMQELNRLWAQVVTVKEWTRQAFRKPAEIRAEFEKSEGELTRFVEAHPEMPQGWYVRARARLYLGLLEGAEEDLKKTTGLEPEVALGWAALGRVLLERHDRLLTGLPETIKARAAQARETLERAIEALRKARANAAGGDSVSRWGLARTQEDETAEAISAALIEIHVRDDYRAAADVLQRALQKSSSEELCFFLSKCSQNPAEELVSLNKAIEIAPHYAPAYFIRGVGRARSSDPEGALADYTKAIEIDPRHAVALQGRAAVRTSLGDLEGALADYTRAIATDPRDACTYIDRSLTRFRKGDLDGAIADCTKGIEINPKLALARSNRAFLLIQKRDVAGALADLDAAIQIDPTYAIAYANRGGVRLEQGDLDGAVADFNRALQVDPDCGLAHFNLGEVRKMRGDFEGAVEDYGKAIACNPPYGPAYFGRGYARLALGDYGGAIADFTKCIEMNPKDARAYINRGSARNSNGDRDGAIADTSRAIELEPRMPESYAIRGFARRAKGDRAGAIEDLERSLQLAPEDWPSRASVEEQLREIQRGGRQ